MSDKKKRPVLIPEGILSIKRNKKIKNIFDVELNNLSLLRGYDSIECHLVLYPFNRNISAQDISFSPFEEYVKDILSHNRSAYSQIHAIMKYLFGLFLGGVITLIFFKLKPDDLFSVESIVSIFGAYMLGKDLWDDIERFFINLTKKWRLRYQENYYRYQIVRGTTLTLYSQFAKKHRYGKSALLPEQMDFIQQSNSQTIRLKFHKSDIQAITEDNAHILSLMIDAKCLSPFLKDGFLLGAKFSLNKGFLGFSRGKEYFQSLTSGELGCLDMKGEWYRQAVFCKKTISWGRIRFFYHFRIEKKRELFSLKTKPFALGGK